MMKVLKESFRFYKCHNMLWRHRQSARDLALVSSNCYVFQHPPMITLPPQPSELSHVPGRAFLQRQAHGWKLVLYCGALARL
jgi:hypothetical protein